MDSTGYEAVKCQVRISPGCKKKQNSEAGYSRTEKYARVGPWLDACEECARIPYEQPAQFQKGEN
ncbi:Uncharacterised protein [uncultured archaeon]|nr:Uncharacterised protein [uncultured archaeon]